MTLIGRNARAGMMVVKVGVVVAALVAAVQSASPGFDISDTANASSPLKKTVVSSKLRLVLAVGVEGTGHDYVLKVNDNLFKNNKYLPLIATGDRINVGKYHIRQALGRTSQHFSDIINGGRADMRTLAKRAAEIPHPGTVLVVHGKYSYPDAHGPDKTLKYLDLRLLAEAAEEEGVDFRVLYLRRPAKDIMLANTVHRRFQDKLGGTSSINPERRFVQYMQVLITDIAVVHSFLGELDPAFVVCHDFQRLGELEQSTSIADFLAPNADVAEPLKQSFMDVAIARRPSTETVPHEGAEAIASRLQRKFDSFETALCTARD